jgi:hypothetical protein
VAVAVVMVVMVVMVVRNCCATQAAKKVTVGALSLRTNSARKPSAVGNWWSDEALTAATKEHGGCASPTLDLFNIHFDDADVADGLDPMQHSTAYFLLEGKITVVGQMPVGDSSNSLIL